MTVGLVAVGMVNPWNLTVVDASLDHPCGAALLVAVVGAFVVAAGQSWPTLRTRRLARFAWLFVFLSAAAVGFVAGTVTGFLTLDSSLGTAVGLGVALATFGLVILLGSTRHDRRWPSGWSFVPLTIVMAGAAIGLCFDVGAGLTYSHLESTGPDGLRLDWVTTGPLSECGNHEIWLKSGSGLSERRLLVDSGYCGNRVKIGEAGSITIGCEKQLAVDTETLRVLSESRVHAPGCK